MISENNNLISNSYLATLSALESKQYNYETMVDSGILSNTAKDKILNLLMEVDYQIRDFEELFNEVTGSDKAIYLDYISGTIPIIKSDVIREKLRELEIKIDQLQGVFSMVQKHNLLRTEYGSEIHSKLVNLDKKQEAIISQEPSSERTHINRLVRLRRSIRIYRMLEVINELERKIKYYQESINLNKKPVYAYPRKNDNKKEIKLTKRIKHLETKKGRMTKKVNKLITKKSILDIPHNAMDKLAYTLK